MSKPARTSVLNSAQQATGILFSKKLLSWNSRSNKREMPWKGEKDPYKIWLSEIILQQTRVEQGMAYYQKFVQSFPTIKNLADAPDTKIFKHWEGLGYYSRCRNLVATAREIAYNRHSAFPKDFGSILQLKGVGPYTAAAIASFAYNLPHPVLDGNVFRVYSRIFNIKKPIDDQAGKEYFNKLAHEILPAGKAALYNQAIMDFGATTCKPQPTCGNCFFNTHCMAYLQGTQLALPIKEKKIKVRERWFNYVIFRYKDQIAIRHRVEKDIWQHLYEYYLLESAEELSVKQVKKEIKSKLNIPLKEVNVLNRKDQKLSHQLIHFHFLLMELVSCEQIGDFQWIRRVDLLHFPFPRQLQLMNKELEKALAGRKFD
jgi:A/G-specific adenine glycosylase